MIDTNERLIDFLLLKTVSRINLIAEKGSLDEQIIRRNIEAELPLLTYGPSRRKNISNTSITSLNNLPFKKESTLFDNGLGGFSENQNDPGFLGTLTASIF